MLYRRIKRSLLSLKVTREKFVLEMKCIPGIEIVVYHHIMK